MSIEDKYYSHIGNSGYTFSVEWQKMVLDEYRNQHPGGQYDLIIKSSMRSHEYLGPEVNLRIPSREVLYWIRNIINDPETEKKLRYTTNYARHHVGIQQQYDLKTVQEAHVVDKLWHIHHWLLNGQTKEYILDILEWTLNGVSDSSNSDTDDDLLEDAEIELNTSSSTNNIGAKPTKIQSLDKTPENLAMVKNELFLFFKEKNHRIAKLYEMVLNEETETGRE